MPIRNKYTTSCGEKGILKKIIVVALALAVIGMGAAVYAAEQTPEDWDTEYPMVNRNVEWSGAGYNGIWGKN